MIFFHFLFGEKKPLAYWNVQKGSSACLIKAGGIEEAEKLGLAQIRRMEEIKKDMDMVKVTLVKVIWTEPDEVPEEKI